MEEPTYKKTVEVVCRYANAMTGKATNNASWMIDWNSILKPNTPYYVGFTLIGGLQTYTGTKPALLTANLNTLTYKGSQGGAPTSNVLGIIHPLLERPSGTVVLFHADTKSNYPSYMERRPNNFLLNLRIEDTSGNLWTTPLGASPEECTITLYFTEAPRDKPIKKIL